MDVKPFLLGPLPRKLTVFIGPGSFLEVRKILPLLTSPGPNAPAFHVVAFSLPGYGFSEAPRQKGFSQAQFAEVFHYLKSSYNPLTHLFPS